jgi:hypothetical protein
MSGKGSAPRPFSVSQEEFANNFDRIFSNKEDTVTVIAEYDDIDIAKELEEVDKSAGLG